MQMDASVGSGIGRYIAIPAVLLLIIAIALGSRAESREDFQDRAEQERREQQADNNSGGSEGSEGSPGESGGSGGSQPGGETRYRYDESGAGVGEDLEPPRRITIDSDNGRIAFEPAGVDGEDGITWDIDEPLIGRLIGFRLVDDEFFVVESGSAQPGDLLISWSDEQIVLTEVGGGVTRIERNEDTVSGVHTDADGTVASFEQNGDAAVRINDDLQAEPEDVGPIFGTDPSDPFDPPFGDSWPWAWIGLGIALTMFIVGMWLTFKDGLGLATVEFSIPQHKKPPRHGTPAQEIDLFERLRQNPDADAVVRELYERVTSGEWGLPSRDLDETPLEFNHRVNDGLPTDAALRLSQLTDLYSAVRFAPQTASLDDRDRAIDIAQRLLHHMRAAATRLEGAGV